MGYVPTNQNNHFFTSPANNLLLTPGTNLITGDVVFKRTKEDVTDGVREGFGNREASESKCKKGFQGFQVESFMQLDLATSVDRVSKSKSRLEKPKKLFIVKMKHFIVRFQEISLAEKVPP